MAAPISRALRIAIVITIVWMLFILVIAAKGSDNYDEFDFVGFLATFVSVGLIPLLLFWGIVWARAATKVSGPKIEQTDYLIGAPLGDTVSCPVCNSFMKLSTTKTGEYADKVFWGCSRYPSCFCVLPLGVGVVEPKA